MIKAIYFQINEKSNIYSENSDLLKNTFLYTEYFFDLFKSIKLKYEKANKINICLCSDENVVEYNDSFKVIEVKLKYEIVFWKFHSNQDFYIEVFSVLEQAFRMLSSFDNTFDFLNSDLIPKMDIHKWCLKKKKLKGVGEVKVIGNLSREAFYVSATLENELGLIESPVILFESFPDRICYQNKINKLDVDEFGISIRDKFDNEVFKDSFDHLFPK